MGGDNALVPSLIPSVAIQPCVLSVKVNDAPSLSPVKNKWVVLPFIFSAPGSSSRLLVANVPA